VADLHFEWDAAKARENSKKHGISFDEAESAVYDDHALILRDPDHSVPEEERLVLIGLSGSPRARRRPLRARGGSSHPPDFCSAGNPI
jgi:uncharacterized DUF497 family protein